MRAPTNGMPNVRERNVVYNYSADSSTPEQLETMSNGAGAGNYATCVYDDQGAVVSRSIQADGATLPQTWQMEYDGDGRMRKLIRPNLGNELYFYDHNGQRMLALERTAGNGAVTLRSWFGGTEIHYGVDGDETKTRAHVNLAGPLARIENRTAVEFTYHDGLQHLVLATDNWGQDKVAYSYTAFGEVFDQVGDADGHLRRFNGKEVDSESGLAYYGYRYYDPVSMQWTRADPLFRFVPDQAFTDPRRANLYVFSLNNANRYLDPDGLDGGTPTNWGANGAHAATNPSEVKPQSAEVQTGMPICTDGGPACTIKDYQEINGNRFITYADGSMMHSYHFENVWRVSTHGTHASAVGSSQSAAHAAQNRDPRVAFVIDTLPTIMGIAQAFYMLAAPGGVMSWGRGPAVAGMGPLGGRAGGTTTLFRAVSKAELDDIAVNGVRVQPGGNGYRTVKLFATSSRDAAKFGRINFHFDSLPSYLVRVQTPKSVMKNSERFMADGLRAVAIPAANLRSVSATPLNFSPVVR